MSCHQTKLTDQETVTDLLCSEKYLTGVYNTFCCETATPALRSCMMNILEDQHRIGEELFSEMSTRGWYKTEKAEEQKLTETRQKFSKAVTV